MIPLIRATFETDQPINLSDMQSVVRPQKLELLNRRAILGLQGRRRHHKRHVVSRVRRHDLVGADGPVDSLDLVVRRVVKNHRRRLRRLTVTHFTTRPRSKAS